MPDPLKKRKQYVQTMCGWNYVPDGWKKLDDAAELQRRKNQGLELKAQCRTDVEKAYNDNVAGLTPKQRDRFNAITMTLVGQAQTDVNNYVKGKYGGKISIPMAKEANQMFLKYVSPTSPKPVIVQSDTDKQVHVFAMLKDGFKYARRIALNPTATIRKIPLPPPLSKEIKFITDAFPPGDWRGDHLIERVVRLYLETKTELRQGRADKAKYNDDKVAKEVVEGVRRMLLTALGKPVPAAGTKVSDKDAKAGYNSLDKTGNEAKVAEFLWAMTNTFVLQAKMKSSGTKHEIDILFKRATAIRQAIGKSSSDPLSTQMLTKTGKSSPARAMKLRGKIKQANIIREQMAKALKRYYPAKAGIAIPRSKAEYLTNRASLNSKVGLMVAATIRGMKDTFKKHFAKSSSAITLSELEAYDVQVASNKDPHMVLFRMSAKKSAGGVPRDKVIDPIANSPAGTDKLLRRAAAMRRYQQALQKMSDADQKDPAKIAKLRKTLVEKLKILSDKLLLLSQIKGVAKDGTVKISFPPKALYPYAEDQRVKSLGAAVHRAKVLLDKQYARWPKLGTVDMVDKIKMIFAELKASNKEITGKAKWDAIAETLVEKLRRMVFNKPVGKTKKGKETKGVGILWQKTGKGVTITITKKTVTKPIMDDGIVVDRRKVTTYSPKFTLKDKKCGSGSCKISFPVLKATLLKGDDGKPTVRGVVEFGGNFGVGVYSADPKQEGSDTDPKPGKKFSFQGKVKAKVVFPKAWNASLGGQFKAGSTALDVSTVAALSRGDPRTMHFPMADLGGPAGKSFTYTGHGFGSLAPKIGKLKISLEGGGGVMDAATEVGQRPGTIAGVGLPGVGKPWVVGGYAAAGLTYGKLFSLTTRVISGYPVSPTYEGAQADQKARKTVFNMDAAVRILPQLQLSAMFSYGTHSKGEDVNEDSTPWSMPGNYVAGGGAVHVSLAKRKLNLDTGVYAVTGTQDLTSGLQNFSQVTWALSASGFVHKQVVLFAGLKYDHFTGKGTEPGSLTSEGGDFTLRKQNIGWTAGIAWAPWKFLSVMAAYVGSDVINKGDFDPMVIKPRHGFLVGISLSSDALGAFKGLFMKPSDTK